MSDYKQYLSEREKIDTLISKGYVINDVQENLSGAFVQFIDGEKNTETLQVLTADARKYFSALIIKQKQV
jgi:hypothetical protein